MHVLDFGRNPATRGEPTHGEYVNCTQKAHLARELNPVPSFSEATLEHHNSSLIRNAAPKQSKVKTFIQLSFTFNLVSFLVLNNLEYIKS